MAADDSLSITPPFGYREIVPVQKTDRVLLPSGATPEFCRRTNTLALSGGEFAAAARDFPIAFASSEGGSFVPVAILGLAEDQNLFVNAGGLWDTQAYLPAFVRRFPFCLARAMPDGKRRGDRVVCVEKAYLDADGLALYQPNGEPTPRWREFELLLSAYESDLERTEQMCEAFARLELFEPFEFRIMNGNEAALTIRGMYRIDEKRFLDLKPASHKAMVTKGLMGRIYAHFNSLENFARLYQRAFASTPNTNRLRAT